MGHMLRGLCALAFSLCCWAIPARVAAYEDQVGIAIDATYGRVVPNARRPDGLLLGVTGSLGLDDAWTARLRLGYGAHLPTDANGETLQAGLASAELLYLVDILEWVPYFGIGADVITFHDSNSFALESGGHFSLGLDWLPTREWVFGADLRAITLLSLLDQQPFYFAFTLSAGWLLPL